MIIIKNKKLKIKIKKKIKINMYSNIIIMKIN